MDGPEPLVAPGRLWFLEWEGQVLGQTQPGSACWVCGDDGSLRLEVLPGGRQADGPAPLLNQEGEGYTLVLGPTSGGTFNPWRDQWRPVDAAGAPWVRFLTGWLAGDDPVSMTVRGGFRLLPGTGRPVAPRPRFLPPVLPMAGLRVQLPQLAELAAAGTPGNVGRPGLRPRATFRQEMNGRAAGRGGGQEVLTLVPEPDAPPGVWRLKSSRKPGRLRLGPVSSWSTGPISPEVFLPLWPLGQLLELDKKNSGTPGPGPG